MKTFTNKPTPRITKKTKSVKRITQKPEDIKGFTPMSKFKADEQKKATGQKTNNKTKDGSWTIHPTEKQWREDMEELNTAQRCILIELNFYTRKQDDCWPTEATLAKNLGLNMRTIIRNLLQLEKKQLVKVRRTKGKVNYYESEIRF